MTAPDSHSIDPEARPLLDEQLGRWQQHRASLYCMVVVVILPLVVIDETRRLLVGGELAASDYLNLAFAWVLAAFYAITAWGFRRMAPQPRRIARRFGWMLMLAGGVSVLGSMLVLVFDPSVYGEEFTPETRTIAFSLTALLLVFVLHFIGSLFVALPPRQAMWPLLPIWLLYAACAMGLEGPFGLRLTMALLFPIAGIPGVFWSVWRHERWVDRFNLRFLGGRWDEVRRDLSEARRVHESIFPRPIDEGPVVVRHAYEPMRDVGGDFLFTRRLDDGAVLVVLVDVTGHGVASALAVTRIHAVLAFVAGPAAGATAETRPGRLIERLNAFVHETLAPQGVYATAIALRADPQANAVRWASAGHPPGMIRRADGSIVELDATCPLLGALPQEAFEADERGTELAAGDVAVLCTDGLIEAEGRGREPFGIDGLRRTMVVSGDALAERTMRAAHRHRAGPATDDTLVVEIVRRRPEPAEVRR